LEHLVNYSSQLIFVSGDKINQQSQIIEAFLGHQSENAEVAIVKASDDISSNEYRSQIFKQLIGRQAHGDFSLPLNQLLADLNGYDGPVLISISNAESLPQKLLQELWELVLQSRFASNKQHLNVLLFADPQWAEQAKSWLPANTGSKPILLSSQSINSSESLATQTDLEKLINTKREQFAERIRGRTKHYDAISPVLAKRWLLSLVGIVFISVFGGILWWQYPEVPQALLSQLSAKFSESGESLAETPSVAERELPQNITQDLPTLTMSQPDDLASETSDAPAEQLIPVGRIEENRVDPNALITDWQSAVSQIDRAARQAKNHAELPVADTPIQNPTTPVNIKKPIVDSQQQTQYSNSILSKESETLDGKVDDYPVEDITSVEQLTLKTGALKALIPLIELEVISQSGELQESNKVPAYEYNEAILLLLAEDKYLLQIAAMSSVQTMQEYIQDNRLQEQLWIYKTQRQGSDWFVLLHNKYYLSLLSATEASTTLPPAMQQGVPFAKTSRQVQAEISQTTN
jgi:DamX protein